MITKLLRTKHQGQEKLFFKMHITTELIETKAFSVGQQDVYTALA